MLRNRTGISIANSDTRHVLDTDSGVVAGRAELDRFIDQAARGRPGQAERPSLYRTGKFHFDGATLIWEYPRQTPEGDQLDLVEVMDLEGDRIARHRIYWGWCGTQHIIANAVAKATS